MHGGFSLHTLAVPGEGTVLRCCSFPPSGRGAQPAPAWPCGAPGWAPRGQHPPAAPGAATAASRGPLPGGAGGRPGPRAGPGARPGSVLGKKEEFAVSRSELQPEEEHLGAGTGCQEICSHCNLDTERREQLSVGMGGSSCPSPAAKFCNRGAARGPPKGQGARAAPPAEHTSWAWPKRRFLLETPKAGTSHRQPGAALGLRDALRCLCASPSPDPAPVPRWRCGAVRCSTSLAHPPVPRQGKGAG